MRDWKLAAKAFAPDLPEEAALRAAAPLDALESVFRPLAEGIPLETEMAPVMLVHPERGE
jgi:spore maturation protein SpmB